MNQAANTSARLDISELTIRAVYASAAHKDQVAAICFPRFSDPSQVFLNRLKPLRTVPCSALKDHRATQVQTVAHTGEWAITIYIEKISFSTPDEAMVTASEWMEAMNGGGTIFKFKRADGKWILIDETGTWQG